VRRRTAALAPKAFLRGTSNPRGRPAMWTAIAYLLCSAFVGLLALTERPAESGE
jgi:hypothetical protein